jgi:hypothetical protein
MSSKKLFFNFIETIFLIFLISVSLIYVILGDRLGYFKAMMNALMPISFYVLFFYFASKFKKKEYLKRQKELRFEIVLILNFFDKVKADAINVGIPIMILLISYLIKFKLDLEDVMQSAAVFILLNFWHRYLFKKEQI